MGRPPTRPANPGVVGANVRRLRDEKGWSQKRLAASCGLSRSTIASVELGKYDSSDSTTVERLAHGLGVPMAALVTPKPRKESLAPHVAAFLASKWKDAVRPTDAELAWLASLPDAIYTGMQPTAETVADLIRWRRSSQKGDA